MKNISELKEKNCRGCGVCAAICPANAISVKLDEMGFYRANINESECEHCGKCPTICTVLNTKKSTNTAIAVFCAHNIDAQKRLVSSSGGIAGALVETAFNEGYEIIGAAYDYDTNRVKHIQVYSENEYYDKICGSKYVPSYTVDAFKKIADIEKPFIIGTPCQIAAIKRAYPKKDMICIDFRCYGVCGYALWDKYIKSIEKKYCSKIISLNSHSKKCSWLKWGVEICFENGEKYFKPKTKDNFGRLFSGSGYAGEHCINCNLSFETSFADIRIEDAWQLSEYLTNDDFKNGSSQVTIMTERGSNFWFKASEYINASVVSSKHAMHGGKKERATEYLNKLIVSPELSIEEVIKKYNKTIPATKRFFKRAANLLFDTPTLYFAVKRLYGKLKKTDKKL